MLKKLLPLMAILSMLFYTAFSWAAVDVNQASAAELDSIKGIGPAMSERILEERKKGNFKDWPDFIGRVKGIGQANASKFSSAGMTVGGATFAGAAAAPAMPAKSTPMTKADAKKAKAMEAPANVDAAAAPAVPAKSTPMTKADAKKAKAMEAPASADKK